MTKQYIIAGVWLLTCSSWLCRAPAGPTTIWANWEKKCPDLMMRRKSEEPHRDPGPAIGQHTASQSPAHYELELRVRKQRKLIHLAKRAPARSTLPRLMLAGHLRWGRAGFSEPAWRVETECEELWGAVRSPPTPWRWWDADRGHGGSGNWGRLT